MKHQRCLTRDDWSGPDRSRCSRAEKSYLARKAWPQRGLAPWPPHNCAASLLSCNTMELFHGHAVSQISCLYWINFPSSTHPKLGIDSWWCWIDKTTIGWQYPNMLLLQSEGKVFLWPYLFIYFWESVLQLSALRFICQDVYHSIIYNIKNKNNVRVS